MDNDPTTGQPLVPVPGLTEVDDCEFYQGIGNLLNVARAHAKRQLDSTIVTTNFEIGRRIVEREQHGKERAGYGKRLLSGLSEYLTSNYGKGYSVATLQNIRRFYLTYAGVIQQTLSVKSGSVKSLEQIVGAPAEKQQTPSAKSERPQIGQPLSCFFNLSWSHYEILMRVENPAARRFYEIEAAEQQWSVRQLRRQVGSSLYERLALSRDKDKVLALANEGQLVENPRDIFKTPYVLEFTGLEQQSQYSETELERALIDNLQKFLLELGKGFLFEARQKRFSFNEKSFYVDLVFYNRLLQCYVLIDLKVDELKHQDLGQMQMYVNYFDRYVRKNFENPTIGILLCKEKRLFSNKSVSEFSVA